eukprot:ctg_1116.g444
MPSLERAKVQLAGLELRNHSVLHRYELATMVTSSWLRSLTRQWYKLVGAMDVAGAPLTAMRTPVSQFRELYTTLATGRATAKSLSYGAVSAFGSSAMAASEIGQATAGSSIRAAARTVGNTGMTLLSRGLMRLGERQWQRGEEEGETAKGSRMRARDSAVPPCGSRARSVVSRPRRDPAASFIRLHTLFSGLDEIRGCRVVVCVGLTAEGALVRSIAQLCPRADRCAHADAEFNFVEDSTRTTQIGRVWGVVRNGQRDSQQVEYGIAVVVV